MVLKNTPTDCLRLAGQQLQAQHKGQLISREDIVRTAAQFGDYQEGSLIPSDYCYNRINRDPASFQTQFFIQEKRGWYRYVGENYLYTGPVYWKPKTGVEQQVGEWDNGQLTLRHDPRGE